jgi:ComF family protein
LQRLIGLYKFERARAGYRSLAGLLDAALPQLPPDAVVVPVPTLPSHIRQRGYDHMLLISRRFAKHRGLTLQQPLTRANKTVQRHATAVVRRRQAEHAFGHAITLNPDIPYVLIDDVMTTGATIEFAAGALRRAGARQVWVAVIARQTLD